MTWWASGWKKNKLIELIQVKMWMKSLHFQLWAGMCSTEWLAFMLKRARKTHSVGEFLRGDKRFHLLKWISDAASHQRTTARKQKSGSEQQQKTNVKIDIAFLQIWSRRDATAAAVLPCELSFHWARRIFDIPKLNPWEMKMFCNLWELILIHS